ncbi:MULTISPECIES: bifunctional aspartate transaminase/aspartate 4-decarboxylase [unclassified Prochlorococcus]|uniref:bifunctional aspartate transaminase/aspartate 4-decarboxylase n=1 Tax=unclassified Prochlorococcus TaxID=2627481 RepID=UPI0005337D8D|nr:MULTISPECIES: bifunctional aspartate transaminase/aspartate 4-decarboxylase [unclassified Prochlorococcus]KGG27759.1 Aspartate/tyrosine/aromatic aminotransferase [Prochlorococcus sp. MIT 0702]KGG29636.1 Aspartate/tyrosine/aromatic aminotransferase [Prochlorococcus sp. MIT 0701]KGG34363.1 Aspartate/tyrosine/aromatic aminotransferase [Prochlorococcus sp. MIT 0703]
MTSQDEKLYEGLSPFELKNKLIELASSRNEKRMLNAGRGNPNWVALEPRYAFFQLGHFALAESERHLIRPGIGTIPNGVGIASRFDDFLVKRSLEPGISLLKKSLALVQDEMDIDPADFLLEMVDGILGDHYPVPDRMLRCSEQIVRDYLVMEMGSGKPSIEAFDLFATEGGTAAMSYVFNSLIENKLLTKGDKIALGTPIFSPYMEIPLLNDFELVEIELMQEQDRGWQYSPQQIEKLADPDIKAFFVVNPSNPTSVAIHPESLKAIHKMIATRRADLIILTDDVYGTFVNGFQSLATVAPTNTILVYSYSKYFGATGWRLGVIGLAQNNIFDTAISALPRPDQQALSDRYHKVFLDPKEAKFIDRMVSDSRTVALHHTAGLSTPQQVFMTLLSLSCLVDTEGNYKQSTQDIVTKRFHDLYSALGISSPDIPHNAHYYTTIDVPRLASERYGSDFSKWIVENHEPIDFIWRLAEEKGIVLMDGGGFDAPTMTIRISLANLPDQDYVNIGMSIGDLLSNYHDRWKSSL